MFYPIALSLFLLNTAFAAVKNPDTFVEVKPSGDISSLDPAWAFDTASEEAAMNIYEPLIFYKGASIKELEPLLSEQVPSVKNGLISADGLSYTFPIRKNVRFHNGETLTCEDARYSILRFMIMDRASGPSFLLLEPIAGRPSTRNDKGEIDFDFDAVSRRVACEGQNLKITLPRPYGPFRSIAAQWTYVVSKEWAVKNGDWNGRAETWKQYNNAQKESSHLFTHTNGTGAFLLERWDRNLKQIILARNDHYWRAPAKLKRVVIMGVPEFATRKLRIASGDADFLDESGRQFEPQLTGLSGVKLYDFPALRVEALFMTFHISTAANAAVYSGRLDGEGIPPDFFRDINVRKGFAHAFNGEAYLRDILRGKATRPHGAIPKEMLGFNPKPPAYSYDPSRATEYLKKAWGGQIWEKGFKMAIYHDANNSYRQMACENLKRRVESLNPKFRIDIRSLDWSTFLANVIAHKLPVFKLGWTADFADPHNFAFAYLHSNGMYPSRAQIRYPEWDKIVEEANALVDPAKRQALYERLQQSANEEVAQIYTDQPLAMRAIRDWVQGFYFNPVFPGVYFYPLFKAE